MNKKALTDHDDHISLTDFISQLRALWSYLLSKWVTVAVAGILGSLIGVTYAIFDKPVYKAVLTFALEEEPSGRMGGLGSLAGQFGIEVSSGSAGSVFTGDNFLALMKSKYIIQKALLRPIKVGGKQMSLANFYTIINQEEKKWAKRAIERNIHFPPDSDPEKFPREINKYLISIYDQILDECLEVDHQDKKTSILYMSISSNNELFSKSFVEVLAKEVSDFYVKTKTKKAAENLAILQRQTDSVRRVFNLSLSGVAISSDANPNANSALQILRVPSQRKQTDVQINQTILSQLVQNLELAKVTLRKEKPLIQIIDRPVFPLPVSQKSPLQFAILGFFAVAIILSIYLVAIKILKDIINI